MFIPNGYADDPAQIGFQFLTVGTDARAAAMGEAFTTSVEASSNSIFYNPANLTSISKYSPLAFSFNRNNWIADITYHSASIGFNVNSITDINFGVLALSFLHVDYGEFHGTKIDATTENGYIDTDIFSPEAYAFGLGYARQMTDRFSFGVHGKYVYQTLGYCDLYGGENSVNAWAFDLGVFYENIFMISGLNFGATLRNIAFSKQENYAAQGYRAEEINLPSMLTAGVSLDVLGLFKRKSKSSEELGSKEEFNPTRQNKVELQQRKIPPLLISVDYASFQDISTQVHIGGEYTYDNIALRMGYKYNINESIENGETDAQGLTTGVGLETRVKKIRVNIDYSYTPFSVFDDVQRLSLRFSF